jgi:hypothetical protein
MLLVVARFAPISRSMAWSRQKVTNEEHLENAARLGKGPNGMSDPPSPRLRRARNGSKVTRVGASKSGDERISKPSERQNSA